MQFILKPKTITFYFFSLGNSLIVINIHTFVMPYYLQILIEFVLLFISLASLKKSNNKFSTLSFY